MPSVSATRRGSSWQPPRALAASSPALLPSHGALGCSALGADCARQGGIEKGGIGPEPEVGSREAPQTHRASESLHEGCDATAAAGGSLVDGPQTLECPGSGPELAAQEAETPRLRGSGSSSGPLKEGLREEHCQLLGGGLVREQGLQPAPGGGLLLGGVSEVLAELARLQSGSRVPELRRGNRGSRSAELTGIRARCGGAGASERASERACPRRKHGSSKFAAYVDGPFAEQDRVSEELHRRLQKLGVKLEDEKVARLKLKQEVAVVHGLVGDLQQESRFRRRLSRAREACIELGNCGPLGGSAAADEASPEASPETPAPAPERAAPAVTAQALRRELNDLRSQERAQRAARRGPSAEAEAAGAGAGGLEPPGGRGCGSRQAGGGASRGAALEAEEGCRPEDSRPPPEEPGAEEAEAEAGGLLWRRLAEAEWRCQQLEEARGHAERRASEAEALAQEAARAESEWREELEDAERRSWLLTELVNEVALQSDLKQLQLLEGQAELGRQLRTVQRRCELLQAVANAATSMSNATCGGGAATAQASNG